MYYRAFCKLVYLNEMCAFVCTNIVDLQDELSMIKKLVVTVRTLRFPFFFFQSIFSTHGNIFFRMSQLNIFLKWLKNSIYWYNEVFIPTHLNLSEMPEHYSVIDIWFLEDFRPADDLLLSGWGRTIHFRNKLHFDEGG